MRVVGASLVNGLRRGAPVASDRDRSRTRGCRSGWLMVALKRRQRCRRSATYINLASWAALGQEAAGCRREDARRSGVAATKRDRQAAAMCSAGRRRSGPGKTRATRDAAGNPGNACRAHEGARPAQPEVRGEVATGAQRRGRTGPRRPDPADADAARQSNRPPLHPAPRPR